jgi:hypothetical protein
VHVSVTSRSVQPSLILWQVGVHDFTFEACSGFTRVTAWRVAQPPKVAFVTRLQPGPARRRPKPLVSYQTYRQLSGWDFHPLAIRAVGAHTTFPLSTRNYLCFLQHSRYVPRPPKKVLCFQQHSRIVRSFFKVTRVSFFRAKATSCRRLRYGPRVPPTRTPLKFSRQPAVSRRQSAEGRKQKAEGGKQMLLILTPESCFFHNPTYYPSLSCAACQEARSPLRSCKRGMPACRMRPSASSPEETRSWVSLAGLYDEKWS